MISSGNGSLDTPDKLQGNVEDLGATSPNVTGKAADGNVDGPGKNFEGKPESHATSDPDKPASASYIPDWFLARNVTLFNESGFTKDRCTPCIPSAQVDARSTIGLPKCSWYNPQHRSIELLPAVKEEIAAHVSTSLLIGAGGAANNLAIQKVHVCLQCPTKGATWIFDDVVVHVAKDLEADIVSVDGQDLELLLEIARQETSNQTSKVSNVHLTDLPNTAGGIVEEQTKGEGENTKAGGEPAPDSAQNQPVLAASSNQRPSAVPGSFPLFNGPTEPPFGQLTPYPGHVQDMSNEILSKFLKELIQAPMAKRTSLVSRQVHLASTLIS